MGPYYLLAMSQTTTAQDEEQTNDDSVAERLIEETAFTTELLDVVTDGDVSEFSDEDLVNLRSELKDLEDTVETVRKDLVESELDTRVAPGERLHGLNRVQSHSKYVEEDAETIVARAVSHGVNYGQFVSISASSLADVAPNLATIGESEYTYYL
jgi:hypothetical protein